MADVALQRRSALDGLSLQSIRGVVSVGEARACRRYSLRGDPVALGSTLSIAMPTKPLTASIDTDRVVLWLGPDEWMLLESAPSVQPIRANAAYAAVDITHRNTGLVITGPRAADLLNAGCPLDLDLSTFPIGMCARTLFAKTEIVLWRVSAETFHVDVWRTFAPYVVGHLNEAIRDLD